eukprot:1144112-Prymnesium_polylepis.2
MRLVREAVPYWGRVLRTWACDEKSRSWMSATLTNLGCGLSPGLTCHMGVTWWSREGRTRFDRRATRVVAAGNGRRVSTMRNVQHVACPGVPDAQHTACPMHPATQEAFWDTPA